MEKKPEFLLAVPIGGTGRSQKLYLVKPKTARALAMDVLDAWECRKRQACMEALYFQKCVRMQHKAALYGR